MFSPKLFACLFSFALLSCFASALTCVDASSCRFLEVERLQAGLNVTLAVSNHGPSLGDVLFEETVISSVRYSCAECVSGNPPCAGCSLPGGGEVCAACYDFRQDGGNASWLVHFLPANSTLSFKLSAVWGNASEKKVTPAEARQDVAGREAVAQERAGDYGSAAFKGLALLLVFSLLALGVLFFRPRKELEVAVVDGRTTVTVSPSRVLHELQLNVLLPEGVKPTCFSEKPDARDTVVGLLLVWRKKKLAKGERWVASYCCVASPTVWLEAVDGNGALVCFDG